MSKYTYPRWAAHARLLARSTLKRSVSSWLRAFVPCMPSARYLRAAGAVRRCVTTTGEPIVQRPPLDVPPRRRGSSRRCRCPTPPPVEQPPEDPAADQAAGSSRSQDRRANNQARSEAARPPPVEPPPVDAAGAADSAAAARSRTPPQGDANAVSRQIRDSVERTRRMLDKIDYGPLSNDRKKAYDDAKLFATQAEDALKAANLVFAKELADKAERLAKELQGQR